MFPTNLLEIMNDTNVTQIIGWLLVTMIGIIGIGIVYIWNDYRKQTSQRVDRIDKFGEALNHRLDVLNENMTSLKLEGATLIDNIRQLDNKVDSLHEDFKKLTDIVNSHSEKIVRLESLK